jgi:hypothetical protein
VSGSAQDERSVPHLADPKTVAYFDANVPEYSVKRLDHAAGFVRERVNGDSSLIDIGCGVGNTLESSGIASVAAIGARVGDVVVVGLNVGINRVPLLLAGSEEVLEGLAGELHVLPRHRPLSIALWRFWHTQWNSEPGGRL